MKRRKNGKGGKAIKKKKERKEKEKLVFGLVQLHTLRTWYAQSQPKLCLETEKLTGCYQRLRSEVEDTPFKFQSTRGPSRTPVHVKATAEIRTSVVSEENWRWMSQARVFPGLEVFWPWNVTRRQTKPGLWRERLPPQAGANFSWRRRSWENRKKKASPSCWSLYCRKLQWLCEVFEQCGGFVGWRSLSASSER